jgi:hypothetical protein
MWFVPSSWPIQSIVSLAVSSKTHVLGIDAFAQYGNPDLIPVAYRSHVNAARLWLVSDFSASTVERFSRGLGFGPLIARP